ncbi:MAG TPA: hypothetical protein VK062_00550 [Burkholderiaceae bacterium]|nr:hypothetical protein [Burkholderiaceae bacterium]
MVVIPKLTTRTSNPDIARKLELAGIHPLLARLWAARGVHEPAQAQTS